MFLQLVSVALVCLLPLLFLFITVNLISKGFLHPEYFKDEQAAQPASPKTAPVHPVPDDHSFGRHKRFS